MVLRRIFPNRQTRPGWTGPACFALLMASGVSLQHSLFPSKNGDPARQEKKSNTNPTHTPVLWTSLASGTDRTIKIDGGHMHVEVNLGAAFAQSVRQGAFARCDLTQQGTRWVGTCSTYMPYPWSDKLTGNHISWCRQDGKAEIKLLTPSRIEGATETFDLKQFDAAKCAVKKTETKQFVWIPKN
jgi:hypothetical protein